MDCERGYLFQTVCVFPVNHWTLAVADICSKTLVYFDSLSRAREDKNIKGRDGKVVLRNLYRYFEG